ncbi:MULTISPECIES: IS66 family insertion sequence element accessory protein TnpB [Paraburkholderia]|uniref:IS66 family insertion sequence element accessory protein TnpB n=1 Tax=Paraburkholderia TaxID=1822464 RepID=UPI0035DC370E
MPGPSGRSGKDSPATEDGIWLLAKRLERGRFIWPKADGGKVHLSSARLSMLLEGID